MKGKNLTSLSFSTILIALMSAVYCQVHAQITVSDLQQYIIRKDNDTSYVYFTFPPASRMPYGDSVWIQDQIVVVDNDSTMELSPQDINGFCYNGILYQSLRLPQDHSQRTHYKFGRQLLEGVISVFMCYEVSNSKISTTLYFKQDGNVKHASSFDPGRLSSLSKHLLPGEIATDEFLALIHAVNRQLGPKTSH